MPLPTMKTPPKCSLSDVSILVYGPSKIGKSRFASQAPDAIFASSKEFMGRFRLRQVRKGMI